MIGVVNHKMFNPLKTKKIVDSIKKEKLSLLKRGIPDTSYFHAQFDDGSEVHEKEYNWSDFSEEMVIPFMGSMKRVFVSKHPIKKIVIGHRGLETTLEPKNGERVYQAIRTVSTWMPDKTVLTKHIGRVVGIIDKNGNPVEERFLSEEANEIFGVKL